MFAWYDLETSGTSPAFDQPLQFAAILTDDEFKPVDRINMRCRLAPHVLPAPWALAVTGVTPDQLTDPGLPSWFGFTQQVRAVVQRWAPATWVGYNSLAFDEEFLRQSFYQCLQPNLYETQHNDNDRLDILRIVYACWELAPGILNWPTDDRGRNTFKLDRVAPANGFTDHAAHDALGDVEATIHLARLVRERAPDLWHECLRNRSKHAVNELLLSSRPVRLIERFGAQSPRSYYGCFCGRNPDNPNSVGFFDLDRSDPADLVDASSEAIVSAVSATPKLIRTIAVNKVPSFFASAESVPLHDERAALIGSRPDFHERVGKALAGRFADAEAPVHVEQQIYGGFYGRADRSLLEQWQELDWPERRDAIGSFDDRRLQHLARRLIFLERRDLVPEDQRPLYDQAIRDRWMSDSQVVPWTTLDHVRQQLEEIEDQAAMPKDQIASLRDFYDQRIAAPFLAVEADAL